MARFSEVSALTADGAGRFLGDLHPEWTIGGKPHGGYLLATLARGVSSVAVHPHVVAASAHYLFAPEPGPVEIETEVLRAGRSASQLRATMRQHGKPCVAALFTTSELDPNAKPYWSDGAPDPGDTRGSEAIRLPPQNASGVEVSILGEVDLRIDPDSSGFTRGAPSGRGELRGWLTLPDDEPFDPLSLIFALDVLPPATFDVEFSGWVPTLELTCYIRALPAPGPVRVVQKAHLIDAQRVDEVCWVWDSTGRLVAHGTQLAGIRLGSPS